MHSSIVGALVLLIVHFLSSVQRHLASQKHTRFYSCGVIEYCALSGVDEEQNGTAVLPGSQPKENICT